ncbi:NADH-quinone oxidoreductase, subunit M [Desulfonema limicola]|uniref:NADH-quinone oxidoreductase, subunit M n=1 Tax=Desulfonema limicola TaxID=45656 RepID=A0A975GGD6_9BACT|nr:NADH-quinone oxidoreductase subunit M [Desulfonema limicola]QTA80205.1 NADH-quinone oxidoreductase, subunit M [Desulfonema limicola]
MLITYADFPYLSAMLLSCVAGLLLILFIPADRKLLIKQVSAVFSGITLAISVYLFFAYDKNLGGIQFAEKISWIPSLGISYYNGADGFSLPMLLLTGIVFFTAVITMWELENRVKEFFALIYLLVAGVFGMFMALDLFFIFVWFDVSLFPMYLLIAVWGSTRKEYAAMKLTLYLLAGSALILPGIVYLVTKSGLNTFDLIALMEPGTFTPFQQKFAFLLFLTGFGILAGMWPFHTWSPVGHVAAPTAVSMIHAGVLMKIGAFGVLRVGMFLCPEGWQYWSHLMAVLATIGIVYGAFAGLSQTDIKYCIGYSSVSHMGIVCLGLATVTIDGLNGAVFQMFAHGIMTALFFSSVGYIYDRTHTKVIAELGGLGRIMPVAASYFIIAALTGIGVPCLASFWAELLVFISAFKVYPVYGTFAVCGLVISALFMLRVVQKTCFGPENKKFVHLQDVSFKLGIPRMILVSVIVIFGLFPFLMFDMIRTASIPFINGLP